MKNTIIIGHNVYAPTTGVIVPSVDENKNFYYKWKIVDQSTNNATASASPGLKFVNSTEQLAPDSIEIFVEVPGKDKCVSLVNFKEYYAPQNFKKLMKTPGFEDYNIYNYSGLSPQLIITNTETNTANNAVFSGTVTLYFRAYSNKSQKPMVATRGMERSISIGNFAEVDVDDNIPEDFVAQVKVVLEITGAKDISDLF